MGNEKNSTASSPDIVTISRTEYKAQQAELTELKNGILEWFGLAKKRQFVQSSKRLQEDLMDQLSLMANEAEAYVYGTKNATAERW